MEVKAACAGAGAGSPQPPSGAGAGSPQPPSGAGAGSPQPPSGAGAGSPQPPSGAGAGSPQPPSGAGAGSPQPPSGAGAGSPQPPSGAGAGSPQPPSGAGAGSPQPPSGAGAGSPQPPSGAGAGSPQPPSGAGAGSPQPPSGAGAGSPQPPSGAGAGSPQPPSGAGAGSPQPLSGAERARAERQRLRARELRAARLADSTTESRAVAGAGAERMLDTGGGFLLPAGGPAPAPRPAPAPPAPPAARAEWPRCEECERRFPASQLLEQFELAVCDACRDAEGKHALVTRTEAKSEFLLKDCDLDLRSPALRCVRRRNPHRAGAHDMRLYVRAAVEARALLVWGGPHALQAERARRERRREEASAAKYGRELRALRRGVRPAARRTAPHEHAWGAERATAEEDVYERTCSECGLTQTFEKM